MSIRTYLDRLWQQRRIRTLTCRSERQGAVGRVLRWFIITAGGAILCGLTAWLLSGMPSPRAVRDRLLPHSWRSDQTMFTVLVADLDGDRDRSQTKHILDALEDQDGLLILVLGEALRFETVGNLEDNRAAAERQGQEWLENRKADLMVWGEVKGADKSLRLRFLAKGGSASKVESHELTGSLDLPDSFNRDFAEALKAVVLSALGPSTKSQGLYALDLLRPAVTKVASLIGARKQKWTGTDGAMIRLAFANAAIGLGDQAGENRWLENAIAACRETIDMGLEGERGHEFRAEAQLLLGIALEALGARESGRARLEEAVVALREALKEYSRWRFPLDWARTENKLGLALTALGTREPGTERFEEAADAYREALKEYRRTRVPMAWAWTQNNLGNVLTDLGERKSDSARLEEAVGAFQNALQEIAQKQWPAEWAATQNNLGRALTLLGERAPGTERLEEAVAAFRESLDAISRERLPLGWAGTKSNLGRALMGIGERESGTSRLEEAVLALREALMEQTQERVPLEWAATQSALGNALARLGEREAGNARLEEATVAIREALKVYTRKSAPLKWSIVHSNLGNVLATLGERESGTARLLEAVMAFREALEEQTREHSPLEWSWTQNNLGTALESLGERESGTERFEEAVAAYQAGLEVFNSMMSPSRAGVLRNLDRCRAQLEKRRRISGTDGAAR